MTFKPPCGLTTPGPSDLGSSWAALSYPNTKSVRDAVGVPGVGTMTERRDTGAGASAQATPATHPLSDARSQVISYFRMVFFFTLKQSPSFRTAPCFPSPHTPGRQSLSYIVISIYTVWGRFLQRVLFCF